MAAPWFKLYPKQFLTDSKVKMLTREHRSILIDLWCYCSEDGSVPSDLDDLSRLIGEPRAVTQKAMAKLSAFFVPDGERLVSVRMQIEAEAYEIKCQKLRENGTKGGRPPKPIAKPDGLKDENQMAPEVGSRKLEKALPPTPKGARSRRSRVEILGAFSTEVCNVVNTLTAEWRGEDPEDGRSITVSIEDMGKAVDSILKAQPNVTPDMLIQAGRDYLASPRMRYKAPQYFFGPQGPWDGFVRAQMTTGGPNAA